MLVRGISTIENIIRADVEHFPADFLCNSRWKKKKNDPRFRDQGWKNRAHNVCTLFRKKRFALIFFFRRNASKWKNLPGFSFSINIYEKWSFLHKPLFFWTVYIIFTGFESGWESFVAWKKNVGDSIFLKFEKLNCSLYFQWNESKKN